MDYTREILNILSESLILITFGKNIMEDPPKIRIKKIEDGDRSYFQAEEIIDNKAFHKNLDKIALAEYISEILTEYYKNSVIYTSKADYYLNISKKGKLSIMKRNPSKKEETKISHNKEKNYFIQDRNPVGFLIDIGIMDAAGKVKQKHYSKFRQINRFLELVNDDYLLFSNKTTVKITDLCCGKGYLTMALQYYFSKIKGKDASIIGMDLKKDVIEELNIVADKNNMDGLKFLYGDIKEAILDGPDLVVALHACDTATDIALAKAVKAGTGLILSVPCCQHELFRQISNEDLSPILEYGIMKDKMTELVTNALRALALKAMGYSVRMIEFTSLEHTMKNIMIKAVFTGKKSKAAYDEYYKSSRSLNVDCSAELILADY